jgi:hypothetical protein
LYDLLDRLETRNIFAQTLLGVRPYSTSRITDLIFRALGHDSLSNPEAIRLNRYRDSILGLRRTGSVDLRAGTIYSFNDSVLTMSVSPLFEQGLQRLDDETQDSELVSQTLIGLSATGSFYKHFAFRVQHFEGREWGNRERDDRSDVHRTPVETVQVKGKTVDFRESRYQFRITLPWLDLDVGKESFDWGPSRERNIFLQAESPSFVYSRLRVAHKRVSFQHLFGALRTRPGATNLGIATIDNGHRRSLPSPKRYVAHRLGLAITDRMSLGIQESVVYGDRGFEPAYAIPISILVGAQSYAGDTDNVAFGLDFSYRLKDQAKLYGALFFDDLSKFDPGAFSNQVGIQGGAFVTDPLGLPNSDLRLEYVRLEPYTYAHNFGINTYTHFDGILGHPVGPNADRITLQVQGWLSPRIRVRSQVSRTREGDNYQNGDELINVGGDVMQGRRPFDSPIRSFLAGDLTTITDLTLGVTFEASAALRFRLDGLISRQEKRPAAGGANATNSSRSMALITELNAF